MNYQQILAETYQENAAVQEQFENDEYEAHVDGHAHHEYDTKEVADQEGFKKFGGDRGHPDIVAKSEAFGDKDKTSVRHEKDVKTWVVNIDSRFRSYSVPNKQPTFIINNPNSLGVPDSYPISVPAHYVMMLATPIRNVYSVNLTSVEFQNTFYEFDQNVYANTSMLITDCTQSDPVPVTIPDGNYTTVDLFCTAVQTAINASTFNGSVLTGYTVKYDAVKNLITVANTNTSTGYFFNMRFITTHANSAGRTVTSQNPYNNGLGYHLGFVNIEYDGKSSYTAEYVPNIVVNNYVYLVINDWNVVQHQDFNSTRFDAFAKLLLTGPKNTLFFDTGTSNTTTKKFFFQQPIDITRLEVELVDPYGNQLNLRGGDFSVTLEIEQVLNLSLYDKLREL